MRSRNWIKEEFFTANISARSLFLSAKKVAFINSSTFGRQLNAKPVFSKLMKVARVENLLKDISSNIQSDEMMIRKRGMSWN